MSWGHGEREAGWALLLPGPSTATACYRTSAPTPFNNQPPFTEQEMAKMNANNHNKISLGQGLLPHQKVTLPFAPSKKKG